MGEELESFTTYKIGQGIYKVVPIIFLIIGTFGNGLSIIVLTRKQMRKSTTSIFLTVLAISDICFLYTGLLHEWLLATFEFNILHYIALCKLHFFGLYFFVDLSGWILVAVTFERVFLVWYPHSGKKICSRGCGLIVIAVLITVLLGINGHLLYGVGHKMVSDGNDTIEEKCVANHDENYGNFHNTIWPWIDLTVFSIGPFILLAIGNSLIIGRLLSNWRRMKTGETTLGREQKASEADKKRSSMIRLLFALNAVYFICTAPVCIYVTNARGWVDPDDIKGEATKNLIWSVFNTMMYANNTFNFVLYFLSGEKFRNEAKSLFGCKCIKQNKTKKGEKDSTDLTPQTTLTD